MLGERGGGFVAMWQGLKSPDVIVGSSLAKGFGALDGDARRKRPHRSAFPRSKARSASIAARRLSQSCMLPIACWPSIAQIVIACRQHLVQLMRRFQEGLYSIGLVADGGLFPVQTLRPAGLPAEDLYQRFASRWHPARF